MTQLGNFSEVLVYEGVGHMLRVKQHNLSFILVEPEHVTVHLGFYFTSTGMNVG